MEKAENFRGFVFSNAVQFFVMVIISIHTFPLWLRTLSFSRTGSEKNWIWFDFLREYAISVVSNVLLTESVISYVLKLGDVNIEAFNSFPFFTKYVFIAIVFAIILPYIREIIRANISISFDIDRKANEK